MVVLLWGATLLLISFAVHLLLWRVKRPQSETRALLLVFAVVPLLVAGILALSGHPIELASPDIARLLLAYVAFALMYVVLYSAIEQRSPTLAIVLRLAESGSGGCTTADLFAGFARDDTLAGRLQAMGRGGLLRPDATGIVLTPRGRFFAELFERASKVFGFGNFKGG